MKKRAIVLLSGGLDSATVLAGATRAGFACYAMSFAYGQRHAVELQAARGLAAQFQVVEHRIVTIDLAAFGGSALIDPSLAVPQVPSDGIPITYVPARNTIFLAYALGWAEVLGARDLFIGVNAVDYSGYPDCRPEFIAAFSEVANLGTKAGVMGEAFAIHTPLIDLTKAQIIERGMAAGVNFERTISCYQPDQRGAACGKCDSCRLRAAGFAAAGVADPTIYR
ncbi:MAG: 7-cyano-7-deazaguanine synthase QueC [Gammaproteobacteria bacterium]|nr:7-cyano-7-deazaguanine synthase QueC [Gammaproteobacteria bacterium]